MLTTPIAAPPFPKDLYQRIDERLKVALGVKEFQVGNRGGVQLFLAEEDNALEAVLH